MAETRWKSFALLFGLICLTEGRFIGSFTSAKNSKSVLNGNRPIDSMTNLPKNLLRPGEGRYKQERLSEAEYSTYSLQQPNGPGTYAFGYDNIIDSAGNQQFRNEEKFKDGTVVGEYGYTDYKNNKIVRVTYTADQRGYRAKTEVLPLDAIY